MQILYPVQNSCTNQGILAIYALKMGALHPYVICASENIASIAICIGITQYSVNGPH